LTPSFAESTLNLDGAAMEDKRLVPAVGALKLDMGAQLKQKYSPKLF
jgi:hypothetical protein